MNMKCRHALQMLRVRFAKTCAVAMMIGLAGISHAQQPASEAPVPAAVLFRNVHVFDGISKALSGPVNVLVRGNKIQTISADSIPVDSSSNTRVIEGGGRTLMPGLIDAHFHMMMASSPLSSALQGPEGYLNLVAAREANDTLMRGFTSIRDLAGPVFSIKRGIDEGLIPGPRIWPSGAMISQTGGHGDYRHPGDLPRTPGSALNFAERSGGAVIADSPDEVRMRTREQLMMGASQIKLAAGGGVSSNYDPLDVSQYTEAEMRAAVEAAENWGTYVSVHAYTPRAIQTAIRAGVKVIDHGQLMDDATARMMAEHGTWLSIQPFLDDEDVTPFPEGSDNRAKQIEMTKGTDIAYGLAKKYRLKTAWGTNTLFDAKLTSRQAVQLVKMTRWYTPAEVLRMATSTNAELLSLSGKRSPYQGKLGVVEEGALADLLLVDGDPIANFQLIADPAKNFLVIMKDGKIYKNLLE